MNFSKVSEVAGFAAGVTVTVALRLSSKWNEPLVVQGKPVDTIPGATRIGDHAIRRRHQEVVGPHITQRAQRMRPGALRDLVAGFGTGATTAPGATYRIEAKLEDRLRSVRLQ